MTLISYFNAILFVFYQYFTILSTINKKMIIIIVAVLVVVVVLVAVILVVLVVNSTSSSCSSSKILTWTGKYKLGAIAGARVGKYNLGIRTSK